MAKSKKNSKSSAKPSVNVRDLKAKKDPKGGLNFGTQAVKLEPAPTVDPLTFKFSK